MPTSFQQTDAAAGATNVQCSGNSNNTDKESNRAQQGGSAGVTARTVTVDASAADLNGVWMEIVNIDAYDGAAGNWTWRINVTTGNVKITLDEVHICHVDSTYGAKNTLGSSVGIGTTINPAGVYSGTVNQASPVTIAAGDMIIVIYAFDNSQIMTNDFAYTPDQIITGPGAIASSGWGPLLSEERNRLVVA